jgi:hypothetical protein
LSNTTSVLLWIGGLGAFGGFLNAVIGRGGLLVPSIVATDEGRIIRPGFIGNVLVGIAAAFIAWFLYDQIVDLVLVGGTEERPVLSLTAGDMAGALLAGFTGGRLLTDRAEKRLFKASASEAAGKGKDEQAARRIMGATGMEALKIARGLPDD